MSVPAPKGLALTGSIMAIVVGGLMLIGGIYFVTMGGRYEVLATMGIIVALLGVTAVVLGAIGCAIKPGVILANAIIFSLVSLLGLIGLGSAPRGAMGINIISLLLYVTTTVFLWVGFPQAARYKRAQQEGE